MCIESKAGKLTKWFAIGFHQITIDLDCDNRVGSSLHGAYNQSQLWKKNSCLDELTNKQKCKSIQRQLIILTEN